MPWRLSEEDKEMVRLAMALTTLVMQNGGQGVMEFWESLSPHEKVNCVSGLLGIQSALLVRLEYTTGMSPVEQLQDVALMMERDEEDD